MELFAIFSALIVTLCFATAIALGFSYYLHNINASEEPHGCKRLGLQKRSNLGDEHDDQYQGLHASNGHQKAKVKSLWFYPVKSCRGVELEQGDVVNTGLHYDRLFSFAQLKSPFPVSLDTSTAEKSKHRWKFMTQRDFPTLAQVITEVWVPDPSSTTYSPQHSNTESGGVLVIKYPYEEDGFRAAMARLWAALSGRLAYKKVQFPLNPTPKQIAHSDYTTEEMEIWKESPMSLNVANTIGPKSKLFMEELQAHLGCSNPLALFRVSPEHPRKVYRCAPSQEQIGWQPSVGFGDAYPLHILNLASVRDVGSRLQKDAPKLSAMQFRPNIIFAGLPPFAEDEWKRIRIGDCEYYVSCRTVRCLLPNVNQITGIPHKVEPKKTLRTFRCIDEGAKGKACLGMQMVPAAERSSVKVGDVIEVLETGTHYYLKQ